jgi:hypothetical protein
MKKKREQTKFNMCWFSDNSDQAKIYHKVIVACKYQCLLTKVMSAVEPEQEASLSNE